MASIRPANITQDGPARIVTFSADPYHRNLDLGQEGKQIVFRVRTPVSGANGENYRAVTPPILGAHTDALIVASYDGAVSRVFVDGKLYGHSNLAAADCVIAALCDSALACTWATLGAILAIVLLALVPWRTRAQALLISLLASLVSLTIPRVLHIAEIAISSQPLMQLMAILGAATVGIAVSKSEPTHGQP